MDETELSSHHSHLSKSEQRTLNIHPLPSYSSIRNPPLPKRNSSPNASMFPNLNIALTPSQINHSIPISHRTYNNNLYQNNIDQSIAYVIPYKYKCNIWLYIPLFIPYLISKLSTKLYTSWQATPCHVSQVDFYLIIDEYGKYHICSFMRKHFNKQQSLIETQNGERIAVESITTFYSNITFPSEKEEFHCITYEYNVYFCYAKMNKENNDTNTNMNDNYCFESPVFYLGKVTNESIYNTFFSKYLNDDEVAFQESIYGLNKLELKSLNFLTIFITQFKNFFFIYPILSIILWIYEEYLFYIVIIISFLIIVFVTAYQKYINKKSIIDFSFKKDKTVTLIKNKSKEEININYEQLVPGVIIKLKENDILPCDCVLLEGFCSVIESTLTGESSSVMKYKLQNNNKTFSYIYNTKSFLYSGTKIEKSFPKEIKVLVVGTGFNTQRGNLIQSVLFPNKSNFNFYKENICFFIYITIILLISTVVLVLYHVKNANMKWIDTLLEVIDVIFIVMPPTLSISLTVGTFYYQCSLSKKKVRCSDEYRLIAAGRVNKIILDKTGTLTKEDLELFGYRTVVKRNGKVMFDSLETDAKLYLSFLCEYYKSEFHKQVHKKNMFNQSASNNEHDGDRTSSDVNNSNEDNKTSCDNAMTYFLECLATCHSIAKIDGEYKGNCIDMKIFDNIKWYYEDIKDKSNNKNESKNMSQGTSSLKVSDQYEMKPKKHYQITEEQYFNKPDISHNNNDNNNSNSGSSNKVNSYSLKVLIRYPFDSRHQSMSVVVKNTFNDKIYYFIKGAPEKIQTMCNESSVPKSFLTLLRKYTLKGFRVLACAFKRLSTNEKDIFNQTDNNIVTSPQNLESNLTFLGFIIFKNRLKKKTKEVLNKLTEEGLFPIIATGDNAFTSISVVKECNLINYNSKFCIMDINLNSLKTNNKVILKCSFESAMNSTHNKQHIYEDIEVDIAYNKENDNNNKNNNSNNIMGMINNNDSISDSYTPIQDLLSKLTTDPSLKLCIHSRVFDYIFFEDINHTSPMYQSYFSSLRNLIINNAILYFRMSPSHKSKLIQLYKKHNKNNIVSMCGDGANDCGALISADVGISLKSSNNNIMTSHLMANTKSISIVNDIIIIGRTCFENSSILLKINLLYSEITTLIRIILGYKSDNMTNSQYLFIDFLIVFCGCCLISTSDPNFKAVGIQFTKEKLLKQFIFSTLGHTVLQMGLIVLYFFTILNQSNYYGNALTNDSLNENNISYYNSYLFVLGSFQCLGSVFAFNYFSVQKESVFKNKLLIIYLVIVCLILMELLSVGVFDVGVFKWKLTMFVSLSIANNFSQKSRLILFGFCVSSFVLFMLWEYVIYLCFVDKKAVCAKKHNSRENHLKRSMTVNTNVVVESENLMRNESSLEDNDNEIEN